VEDYKRLQKKENQLKEIERQKEQAIKKLGRSPSIICTLLKVVYPIFQKQTSCLNRVKTIGLAEALADEGRLARISAPRDLTKGLQASSLLMGKGNASILVRTAVFSGLFPPRKSNK